MVNTFVQYYRQNWVLFLLRQRLLYFVLLAIVNAEFDILRVSFGCNGRNSDDRAIKKYYTYNKVKQIC
jgi:hypothetical protein